MKHQNSITTPTNMQECLILQAHYTGIPKITKNNYKIFFKRGKTIELLGYGLITKDIDSSLEGDARRMPTLLEVKESIGLSWDEQNPITKLDDKGWKNAFYQLLDERLDGLIKAEEGETTENEGKQT